MNEYLTVIEAAQMLGISANTVRTFLKKGYFKGKRFGRQYRIERVSFLEFLESAEVKNDC